MQLEGTTKQGPPPFFMVAKQYVPIFLGSSPPRSWRCAVGVELQTLASSSPSHEPALGGLRQFRSETKDEREKSCRRRRGLIKTTIIIEKNQIVSKPNPMNLGKTNKKSPLQPASFLVRPRRGVERGTYFVHRRQGVVKSALRQPDHAKQCGSEAPAGKLLSMSLDFCRRLCLFPPQAHAFLTASTPRMTLRSHTRTKARA